MRATELTTIIVFKKTHLPINKAIAFAQLFVHIFTKPPRDQLLRDRPNQMKKHKRDSRNSVKTFSSKYITHLPLVDKLRKGKESHNRIRWHTSLGPFYNGFSQWNLGYRYPLWIYQENSPCNLVSGINSKGYGSMFVWSVLCWSNGLWDYVQ